MSKNLSTRVAVGTFVLATAFACTVDAMEPATAAPSSAAIPTVAPASTQRPQPPAARRAAWDPSARVVTVETPANITLDDGRLVHVPRLNMVLPYFGYDDPCERDADLTLARSLLLDKNVTVTPPKKRPDTSSLVPAGHVQADVEVDGRDYAVTFEARAHDHRRKQCPPELAGDAPTGDGGAVEDGAASGGWVPDVDVHHGDTNHRDGAFTGGYCRGKWWC